MGASHLFSPCSDLSLQVRVFLCFQGDIVTAEAAGYG